MKNPTFRHLATPPGGVLLVLAALTAGCATASTKTPASTAATRDQIQTTLPKFSDTVGPRDAFLDPTLDRRLATELQQDIARGTDSVSKEKYPAWNQLALPAPAVPDVVPAENRFLLRRTLARMTGGVAQEQANLQRLDSFLDQHPEIQQALEDDPSRLVGVDFMVKYPPLAKFFDQHPDLFSVFFQHAAQKTGPQTPPTD